MQSNTQPSYPLLARSLIPTPNGSVRLFLRSGVGRNVRDQDPTRRYESQHDASETGPHQHRHEVILKPCSGSLFGDLLAVSVSARPMSGSREARQSGTAGLSLAGGCIC
jgi:hypothetical protein